MGKTKKLILALLLCTALLLGIGAPAFADFTAAAPQEPLIADGERVEISEQDPAEPTGEAEILAEPQSDSDVVASGSCGENVTWRLYQSGLLSISGSGAMTNYTSVSSVPWYSNRSSITSVSVGSGVTSIGSYAFYGCSSLTSVTLPYGVTSIGSYAFSGCGSLTSITLPSGVTSIGSYAFYGCGSLTSITLPSGLTSIGSYAFYGCCSLTSITIPSGVTKIGGSAFSRCTSLTSINVAAGNSSFAAVNGVLFNAAKTELIRYPAGKSAASYTVPSGVTSIGSDAFSSCIKITSITFPSGVTSIGSGAFYGCRSLTSITLPSGLTSIGLSAFYGCCSLTSITIPSSVTKIGGSAFYDCSSLTSITIPSGVTSIGSGAFNGCTSLTSIDVAAGNSRYITVDGVLFNYAKTELIRYPAGKSAASYSILSDVTSIDSYAFSSCRSLTGITLPSRLTSIGSYAFYGCRKITSITLPSGVTSIGSNAFNSCHALNSVSFAGPAPTIESYAFYGVTATAYYPAVDETWTSDKLQNYGGTLTWISQSALPTINVHPSDLTVNVGETAEFSVAATGYELNYQWQYMKPGETTWNNVKTNGTSASYKLTTEARHNGYRYRCKVSNAAGEVTSGTATLTVKLPAPPAIYSQPTDATVMPGDTATFSVYAEGSGLSYQWYYLKPGASSWTQVSNNGTSATYSLTAEARHDGYQYKCKVTNAGGSVTSGTAKLSVAAIAIDTQPNNQQVTVGNSASFTVTARGAGELSYQWYYKKPLETTWRKIANGGTSATYTLQTAEFRHCGYRYRCKISDGSVTVTSNEALLRIDGQPYNFPMAAAAGETVTFDFGYEINGVSGLRYSWVYFNTLTDRTENGLTMHNVTVNGNSPSYTLSAKERHNCNIYMCVAYLSDTELDVAGLNNAGDQSAIPDCLFAGNEYGLIVIPKPTIDAQPADVAVPVGQEASFTVAAHNTAINFSGDEDDLPVEYQWYYQKPGTTSWTAVSAASGKEATYTLTAAERHDGYKYRCAVTTTITGTPQDDEQTLTTQTTSETATLTIVKAPTITTQPKSVTVAPGETASFTVEATGGGLSYQWKYCKPGENTWNNVKNNGTSATCTLTAQTKHNGYKYKCVVTNAAGTVESSAATLTVAAKPVITSETSSVTVVVGGTANFKVTATGATAYQWYYQKPDETTWHAVSAASGKTATYTFTTEARHNGYKYRCKVSNEAGYVYSKTATLTVITAPVITTQPKSVTVSAGQSATFKVVASGINISYKWQYKKPGEKIWRDVENNGTSATYKLTTEARHNGYMYRCVVTNAAGSVTSSEVTLTVK